MNAPASSPPRNEVQTTASLIVVTYRSSDEIAECLDSVLGQELEGGFEVIVADNASDDGTAELIAGKYPEVILIRNEDNLGFAAANNQAFLECEGRYLFLINPDSVVEPGALAASVKFLDENPECGLVGGLLLDDDGHRAPSARKFPTAIRKALMISGLAEKFPRSRILSGADYQNNDHESAFPVDWVPGAFTAIRREMLEQIGFFDERYFLYYEETDLCLRARRQGWTIQFLPEAVVHHTGGGSSRKVTSETFDEAGSQIRPFRLRSECLYHRKNRGLIALLSTMGFEWGWHRLRACIHSFKRSESSRLKREHSTQLAREIERALADTSLGRISPTRPW